MYVFYSVSIYANKDKYYSNIRLTLTLLPSFVAIIAELGYH